MMVQQGPYFVHEKILQVFPGENLFVETEVAGDTIASMKVVKEIKHPEKTITIKFEQVIKDKVPQQMILTVSNPFTKSLLYNAAMYRVGSNDWSETSIVPVRAGLSTMEMWSDIIITLALHDWRFIKN